MIQELTMRNFKSFATQRGTIRFGGLSLIIGTNASGKSNIRDGLRFIHGVSRGYSIAEIIGEKYVEGGVLQWKGIRGGVKETILRNGNPADSKFTIELKTKLSDDDGGGQATYSITVDVGDKSRVPTVVHEELKIGTRQTLLWKEMSGPGQMNVYLRRESARKSIGPAFSMRNDRPALTQIQELDSSRDKDVIGTAQKECKAFLKTISSVRFLDLEPQALRRPSIPGQTILGDKGENLSSVLQAICADAKSKEALIEWTRELTPLDVVDMQFPEVSLEGKIQLQIVETGGREISAESASDGTLRFLAFAAALLGTEPARFYFFEEIENGIHPNRAHLLINLLRNSTRKGGIQVAGTTHSPALLNFLDDASLHDASLVYRADSVSKIRSFADIPALWQVAGTSRAGELHGAGWFENTATFLESEENQ
jgi:predicted ATPase